MGQRGEEVVNVEGNAVRVTPRCGRRCRRPTWCAGSRVLRGPVIPDTAGLLEAVQRAIEFEDLAGVLAPVDAFRYAHVQLLRKRAMAVRLADKKAVAGGKSG